MSNDDEYIAIPRFLIKVRKSIRYFADVYPSAGNNAFTEHSSESIYEAIGQAVDRLTKEHGEIKVELDWSQFQIPT